MKKVNKLILINEYNVEIFENDYDNEFDYLFKQFKYCLEIEYYELNDNDYDNLTDDDIEYYDNYFEIKKLNILEFEKLMSN